MCMFSSPKPPKPPLPRPADEVADDAISNNRLAAAGTAREETRLTSPLGQQTASNTSASKMLLGA